MKLHPYTNENYDEVISFLGALYQIDKNRPYWLPGRWEYAAYLCSPLFIERGYPDWKRFIRIARNRNSIVGIVNSENPDHNVYLHTHPNHRGIEEELIEWAEKSFETEKISVWTFDDDTERQAILKSRGYRRDEQNDYLNWCDLTPLEPRVSIPKRYNVVSFEDGFDLTSRIDCSTRAFSSKRFSKEVYRFMQKAPNYDPSLDLVITDKDEVVSLCTVWPDRKNDLGYIEPVATAPEYQRKGLGLAVVNEAMRRLKERGFKTAYVGSAGDWRKAFYTAAGFNKSVLSNPWTKRLR
jgi:predicted N-acetyltransferase YhbS